VDWRRQRFRYQTVSIKQFCSVLMMVFFWFFFADVTIIPTYDSDALATWVSANEDVLARNRIDLAPSASRCTINLQDHETSCSAYRLEF